MTSSENHAGLFRSGDREIVEGAFEQRYFEESAEVSVADLAREFDLPESEVRRRLARGLAALLKAYRDGDDDPDLEGLLADADHCNSVPTRLAALVQSAPE